MAPLDAKFNFIKRRAPELGVHNSIGKIRREILVAPGLCAGR